MGCRCSDEAKAGQPIPAPPGSEAVSNNEGVCGSNGQEQALQIGERPPDSTARVGGAPTAP